MNVILICDTVISIRVQQTRKYLTSNSQCVTATLVTLVTWQMGYIYLDLASFDWYYNIPTQNQWPFQRIYVIYFWIWKKVKLNKCYIKLFKYRKPLKDLFDMESILFPKFLRYWENPWSTKNFLNNDWRTCITDIFCLVCHYLFWMVLCTTNDI